MNAFLLLTAIGLLWAGSLLVRPFGPCWRCRGKGNIRKGRRAPRCRWCKGKGRRQRTGSRTVHRIRRHATAGWQNRHNDDRGGKRR